MSITLLTLGLLHAFGTPAAHAQVTSVPALPLEAQVISPNDNPVGGAIDYDVFSQSSPSGNYSLLRHEGSQLLIGFSFENDGPNRIIPTPYQIGEGPQRMFDFTFYGQSRQDIQMHITDVPDEFLSRLMESYIYLFPRKNLPAIIWPARNAADQSKFTVVLSTGESVIFDTQTKMMAGGVMSETRQIDLNPDRFSRKFAGINYTGTGVMVRLDKRGNDPRLNNTATITFGAKKCVLPASLMFNQDETSTVQFLFPTDEGFNTLLKNKCHFSFL
jgi:hypothetical protein